MISKEKSILVSGLLCLTLASILFVATFTANTAIPTVTVVEPQKVKGHVDVYVNRLNPYWKTVGIDEGFQLHYQTDNVITWLGKNFTVWHMGDPTIVGTTNKTLNLSLSANGDLVLPSLTVLAGEINANGFTRAYGTYAYNASMVAASPSGFNVTKTWTATGTQNNINSTGLHWNSVAQSDQNMYACANFANVSFLAGDQLRVIYSIQYS